MKEQDKQNFQEIMAGLGEVYSKNLTPPLMRIYFDALSSLSIEQVSQAASMHLKNTGKAGEFFPRPGQLIGYVTTDVKSLASSNWSIVVGEMSRVGWCGTPRLDHITQAVVIALGGWPKLCKVQYDDLPALERKFVERYTEYDKMTLKTIPDGLPGAKQLIEHNLSRVEAKRLGESNE